MMTEAVERRIADLEYALRQAGLAYRTRTDERLSDADRKALVSQLERIRAEGAAELAKHVAKVQKATTRITDAISALGRLGAERDELAAALRDAEHALERRERPLVERLRSGAPLIDDPIAKVEAAERRFATIIGLVPEEEGDRYFADLRTLRAEIVNWGLRSEPEAALRDAFERRLSEIKAGAPKPRVTPTPDPMALGREPRERDDRFPRGHPFN